MRTYPENTEDLKNKHNFSFPIDKQKLELIHNNIILRHDIAFVFLKHRILNSLKTQSLFENELSSDLFLDKKFNTTDRLKIYNAIKSQLPQPERAPKKLRLYSLFHLNEKPKIDTRALTIRDLICDLIKQSRVTIKGEFETFFKDELDNLKY
jgi:hypothetical protein